VGRSTEKYIVFWRQWDNARRKATGKSKMKNKVVFFCYFDVFLAFSCNIVMNNEVEGTCEEEVAVCFNPSDLEVCLNHNGN
jgi:hypothetical protein